TASGRSLGFAAIENLTGGSGDDLFRVTSAPGGVLDGGGGNDTLDFGTAAVPVDIVLGGADGTGFRGTGTVPFAGIDSAIGSSHPRDTLSDRTGATATHWTLGTAPSFSDGTHTLAFSRLEDLSGGQNVPLASGTASNQTATDLTLRYDPTTRAVQLVDTA